MAPSSRPSQARSPGDTMNPLIIAFVTSVTALMAAMLGPLVSLLVARMQIRASVVSNSRERWIETLRDAVAEYVALLLTASLVKQAMESDPVKAVTERADLRQTFERIVMIKNKILLMVNPREDGYTELRQKIEASYELL